MTPKVSTMEETSKSRIVGDPAPWSDMMPRGRDQYLQLFRTMVLSRKIDDAEIALRKRNQVFFQISGAGHEAIGVAMGYMLKSAHDWFHPYYRDRALMLQLGMTPYEMLLSSVGAMDDPNSGGRQMPSHWGLKRAHVPSQSSPTGTQFNQAVGCAEAGRYIIEQGLDLPAAADEITMVSSGDGATSEGEFAEAISSACIRHLPVLFVVEDNEYAISVPVEENTPGGDISQVTSGYPGLTQYRVDGNDLPACLRTMAEISYRMRRREIGPVLLHAKVTRPYSHSLSDDHAYYRTKEELENERQHDCLTLAERFLLDAGICSAADVEALKAEVEDEVHNAVDRAIDAPKPPKESATDHLYATENSPLDRRLYAVEPVPTESKDALPMGQAINRTMMEEMGRDLRVVLFGEDVADASRECALAECKGKGGVFKITHGLQTKFGKARVFNSPLAEANIAGRGVGMAVRGLRPICEIQFFDYIWPAFHQLRNEAATMRYRSAGVDSASMVVRVPIGGYLKGGAIYHSQTGEGIFVQCPGLRVVYPSNAADAMGLLRTAIRCDDPVIFLEHKHLYYQGYNRSAYPGENYTIPFGQAAVRREGSDATVVTWGAMVQRSLEAAEQIAREQGRQVEVIDIRTLNPLDEETIFRSVRKTGKLLVVSEEGLTCGFGAEIAALVSEHCFEWLDAPVRRVASLDTWVAYAPVLEEAILPGTADVVSGLTGLLAY